MQHLAIIYVIISPRSYRTEPFALRRFYVSHLHISVAKKMAQFESNSTWWQSITCSSILVVEHPNLRSEGRKLNASLYVPTVVIFDLRGLVLLFLINWSSTFSFTKLTPIKVDIPPFFFSEDDNR